MRFEPLCGLPRDREISQLPTLMDANAMARQFSVALCFGHDDRGFSQVDGCEILWAKYKPGKNCTVCYRLLLRPCNAKVTTEQLVYARIFADGDGWSRYQKAAAQPAMASNCSVPFLYLADLSMVAWFFPNDRKLRGLAAIRDRGCLTEMLPAAVASALGDGWQLDHFEDRLVHYVPEHTCAVKVHLLASHRLTGAQRPLTLYGKAYYNRAGARTFANMRALWQLSHADAVGLTVAQPCAYDEERRILWQKEVSGRPLLELGLGSSAFYGAMSQAARALALLQRADVAPVTTTSLAELVIRLIEVSEVLGRVVPENALAIRALVADLARKAPAVSSREYATLHGDLHLGNVLIDAERAALIDMDGLSRGVALCDVGSFAAALIYHALLNELPSAKVWSCIESFVSEYRQNVSWPVSEEDLRWHIATALISERAFRSVTRLKSGRQELFHKLLDQAWFIGVHAGGQTRTALGAQP